MDGYGNVPLRVFLYFLPEDKSVNHLKHHLNKTHLNTFETCEKHRSTPFYRIKSLNIIKHHETPLRVIYGSKSKKYSVAAMLFDCSKGLDV